jgi:hypothetical protein
MVSWAAGREPILSARTTKIDHTGSARRPDDVRADIKGPNDKLNPEESLPTLWSWHHNPRRCTARSYDQFQEDASVQSSGLQVQRLQTQALTLSNPLRPESLNVISVLPCLTIPDVGFYSAE